MEKRGRHLQRKPVDETKEKSLATELGEFKRAVRRITNASDFKTKMAFTHDQRINRLRGLAIYGSNPAIRATPYIEEEMVKEAYVAIMQQNS